MDLLITQRAAVLRLHQRCIDRGPGDLLFRLDGGGAVAVSREEWNAIGTWFRDSVAGSARLLRWAIGLQVPIAIALLALIANTPALRQAIDAVDGPAAVLAWVLLSFAAPLVAFVRHDRAVTRATRTIVDELAARPRVAEPVPPRPGGLHAMEIVVLVLFGPGALIDLYGSLMPHALDGTPWMGRGLGWSSVAALVAFGAVVILRRRASAGARG